MSTDLNLFYLKKNLEKLKRNLDNSVISRKITRILVGGEKKKKKE